MTGDAFDPMRLFGLDQLDGNERAAEFEHEAVTDHFTAQMGEHGPKIFYLLSSIGENIEDPGMRASATLNVLVSCAALYVAGSMAGVDDDRVPIVRDSVINAFALNLTNALPQRHNVLERIKNVLPAGALSLVRWQNAQMADGLSMLGRLVAEIAEHLKR